VDKARQDAIEELVLNLENIEDVTKLGELLVGIVANPMQ
jgi:hypothetical protein